MSRAANGGLEGLRRRYVEYLVNNVGLVTSLESWMKTLSYLVAGRISKSHSAVIAELMYASSNLISLFNDYILRKYHNLHGLEEEGVRTLKIMLSGLEAIEVFIEIAGRRYGDSSLRWTLIFCVELIKTIGRFVLQYKYKTGLRHFPLMKRLNRKAMQADGTETGSEDTQPTSETDSYYTLPHSGRKVKSISARYKQGAAAPSGGIISSVLTKEQTMAESLHNLQPLIHLCSAAYFGGKSWKPWLASLAADTVSLSILRQPRYKYTKGENSELLRRKFVFWMYLLRSPCYDRYTKMRLLRLMSMLQVIPGVSYIITAIIAYLPEWQSTYFYTWNS